MRSCLASWTMALSAAMALVGCGPSYPADRPYWYLISTPNAEPESIVDGTLELFESSEPGQGARLNESFKKDATNQNLTVFWTGEWSGDTEGVELDLTCTDSTALNVEAVDCTTATLKLSCVVAEEKLDCGGYKFQ